MAGRVDQEYQELKERAHRWVVERLDEEGIEVGRAGREGLEDFIRNSVGQFIAHYRVPLSTQDMNLLVRDIIDEVTGFGPLEPLLADDRINDILVNGPEHVFVEVAGVLQRAHTRFINDDHVIRVIRRMLAPLGRRLDEASPMVDARLPDGSRVNAIIPPLALDGPSISVRKFTGNHLSAQQLIDAGSMTEACLDVLVRAVESRRNIIVSGGTGTGKTTMLNALLSLVPASDRLVIVEDASELRPEHPHLVALEARPPNIEGAGAIPMRVLVKQALRMRPDRLVVGEVRGDEVVDMLAAMNTGHEGGCGTIHANSAGDVPSRLEGLALAAGLNRAAAHSQMAAAIDVVIHLARDRSGRRQINEIGVLDRDPTGTARVIPAVVFQAGEVNLGPAIEELRALVER